MQEELTGYQRIEKESGELNWSELQAHFARGVVIYVSKDENLISVAEEVVKDNASHIEAMLESKQISRVSDDTARQWVVTNPLMRAVVIAPWVLIQEISIT